MAFSISEFKSQLTFGGARPTLFEVQITNPVLGFADFKIPFMVRSAELPASTVGSIQVPYFGRIIKYAGDRTFGSWTVTIINDEDFAVRNAMESWSNSINTHITNFRSLPESYKSQAQVVQYGKGNNLLREYVFEGLFPTSIDAIPLAWGDTDTIESFNVTFEYDLWRTARSGTGNSTT